MRASQVVHTQRAELHSRETGTWSSKSSMGASKVHPRRVNQQDQTGRKVGSRMNRHASGQSTKYFSRTIGRKAREGVKIFRSAHGRHSSKWVLYVAHSYLSDLGSFSWPPRPTAFSFLPCMTDKSQRPKSQDRVLSALNRAINGLNIAKEATSTTPVNPVFGSVAILLTMIRVSLFLSRE